MGELEGKITEILNSPEDMQNIMNIARSLAGGDINLPKPKIAETPTEPLTEPESEPEQADDSSGFSLGDLEITPETLKTLGSVMSELTSTSHSGTSSMLDTVTPFLKPERQEQLKRAFSLAKMAKIALGIFSDTGGSDVNV